MKVIFCLPGRTFSGTFLQSWTHLVSDCLYKGINIILSQRYNSNVYYVRPQCLGANVLNGSSQRPFGGKVQYDYIMWIDSDQVFKPEHFFKLLSHKENIVGGLYLMEGGKQYAAVQDWDKEVFKKTGSFKFLEPPDLSQDGKLMEVVYSGFGFLLIKFGVFENIEYPWFEPQISDFGDGIRDFASEDVSFCLKARKTGYKIYIDPSVIVGHEKTIIY